MKVISSVGVIIAIVVALSASVSLADQVGGQGFDLNYPAQKGVDTPHLKTPHDTRLIAPEGPKEAQLVCLEKAPVRRLVNCDIITWDVCGNIDGEDGNHTDWRAHVQHVNSNQVSRLVSPIIWMQKGVARFHFTPTTVGVHRVRVFRHVNSEMEPLNTPNEMTFLVIVHDVVAKCAPTQATGMLPQLQRIMWAQASWTNEHTGNMLLEHKKSKATSVIQDPDPGVYTANDGMLQQNVRRNPVPPVDITDAKLAGYNDDRGDFNYCDILQAQSRN